MKSALLQVLNITHPIVQAPMLGVTTPAMVAAISNAGGLGSLPLGGLSPEAALPLIQATKALTSKPFAVNLFVHEAPEVDKKKMDQMQDFLAQLCARYPWPYIRLQAEKMPFYSYRELVPLLVKEGIKIVSFTFGMLDAPSVEWLKKNGAILIGTATSVKEAVFLQQAGVDLITVQGTEAGGHRGTFLEHETLPLIGLMSLLPQVASKLSIPLLAAGGIYNGKTIKAAYELGAAGVQLGTAFIASNESAAIPSYKTALQQCSETDIVLTKAFSGRWARGLVNTLIKEVALSGPDIPAYPIQQLFVSSIRQAAIKSDNHQFTALWAGQSAPHVEARPCSEIFERLVKEMEMV